MVDGVVDTLHRKLKIRDLVILDASRAGYCCVGLGVRVGVEVEIWRWG